VSLLPRRSLTAIGAVLFAARFLSGMFVSVAFCLRAFCAENAVQFLEDRVKKDPADFIAQNMLASHYLDLFRGTGQDEWLAKARRAAETSGNSVPTELNTAGLALLARVQLGYHQFAAARDTARRFRELAPDKIIGFAVLGDALLELGDYREAVDAYKELARREQGGIDSETRLARLALIRGELDAAGKHFGAALAGSRQLSPPSPQLVAWCCVQLGQFYFGRGDWANAEKQYQAALEAMPDYYAALDHIAELRAAQEKHADAINLYEKIIARLPRPEFCQALGDLYLFVGKTDQARPWHERALAGYLKFTEQEDARYFHHLAGFYCDSAENPGEALKWARKDLQIRHTVFAHDALAWALYRNGQFGDAAAQMKTALAEGTKDAHLFFHASMIFSANGDIARGKEFLRRAAEINPRYNSFHEHR
jgi:tetratricopeptide (TPR) repeat protein